jgi:hypothetical protein
MTRRTFLPAAAGLALAPMAAGGAPAQQGLTVILDLYENHNRTVDLELGDTLVVRLPRPDRGGPVWWLRRNNAAILKPVVAEPAPAGAERPKFQEFRFQVVGTGGDELAFDQVLDYRDRPRLLDWVRTVVMVRKGGEPITVHVTENNDRDRLPLKRNDTLVVALPAGGRPWIRPIDDQDALSLEGPPKTSGTPPEEVYRFKAVRPGGVRLRFVQDRPEHEDKTPRKFEVSLDIG